MVSGLQTLSDREKDVLRLLSQGHDSKSAAGELGISVHAVNERLRAARRKLGVSSSREAARLLANGPEGHKSSVDKKMEEAGSTAADDDCRDSKGRNPAFALAVGGFAVSFVILIAMLAASRSNSAAGPLPNWNVQAALPKTTAQPANRVYLSGNRLLWNGNEASEASIREFLAVELQMSPQPLTMLSHGPEVAPQRLQHMRQLIDDTLRCTPATCLEVTAPMNEPAASPKR